MKKILTLLLVLICSFSMFAKSGESFALVLSGGGARGIAEIAVLEELEERGLYPDYIIGTSIGALVGAFSAAGYSASEIEHLILSTDLASLFTDVYLKSGKEEIRGGNESPRANILTIDFSRGDVGSSNGIIDDQKIGRFIRENLINVMDIHTFDALSIPYRAIGTDLLSGDEIIFSSGSLYNAMRSSMAIPIVFSPGRTESGRYVVDGGMVNNLATDVARDLGADVVLAVDLNDVYKTHTRGESINNVETLTGLTFQVLDLVTGPNAMANYENADYVIIPELEDIGTMDFDRAQEILEIGKKAVEDNIEIFDLLEERLEGEREKPFSYFDRENLVVNRIIYNGLEHYSQFFDSFIGKTLDSETVGELENLIAYIKMEEGLKTIGYDIYSGNLYIRYEDFSSLSSSFSLGLGFDTGFISDMAENESLFYFIPSLSLLFDIALPGAAGTVLAGIDITNYTSVFGSYYYNFASSLSLFASLRLGVGELSMLSILDRIDRMTTSDFLFSIESGIAYDYYDDLRLELSVDLDTISLGSLKNYESRMNYKDRVLVFSPMLNFNLKYRSLDKITLNGNGIDIDFDSSIYLKAPLMYNMSLSFRSIIPFSYPTKIFINGEASTLRGEDMLASSYETTKGGRITRDYLMLETGLRLIFDYSFFLDFGIYAEAFETRDYHNKLWSRGEDYNLVPFSMINDWLLGLTVSFGNRLSFGDIMIKLNVSYLGDLSIGVCLT